MLLLNSSVVTVGAKKAVAGVAAQQTQQYQLREACKAAHPKAF
jgi:hypothetical protein